jgi:hypothetical protein
MSRLLKYSLLRNGDQQTPANGAGMNHQYFVALHAGFYCHRWIIRTAIRRKIFWVLRTVHEAFPRWRGDDSKQQINKGYCLLGCDSVYRKLLLHFQIEQCILGPHYESEYVIPCVGNLAGKKSRVSMFEFPTGL